MGLIDTLCLARRLRLVSSGRSLTSLLDHLGLTCEINQVVPTGRPHRAFWDVTAAAYLLAALLKSVEMRLPELIRAAGSACRTSGGDQPTLWD